MTEKQVSELMGAIAPVIRDYHAAELATLRAEATATHAALLETIATLTGRLAALEQRQDRFRYCGVWEPAIAYQAGNFVTHAGSLWHADRDSQGLRPGVDLGWTLTAKRGKDARDARAH